jgi:hypothetical protein
VFTGEGMMQTSKGGLGGNCFSLWYRTPSI